MIQGSPLFSKKMQKFENFLSTKTIRFTVIFLLITSVFFHVIKMSQISTKGYEMSKLQKQIALLEEEKQRIDIDIASMSSMEYIQGKVSQMAFVPIEKPSYIKVQSSLVAKR